METEHRTTRRRWEKGWDGHKRAQLRRWAALPLGEKIAMVEEMERTSELFAVARRKAGLPVYDPRDPPVEPPAGAGSSGGAP